MLKIVRVPSSASCWPHRHDFLEGRVESRGEEEAEAEAVEGFAEVGRIILQRDPEGAEQVGTSAAGGDRAVPVLDDRLAEGGEEEGGGRGKIEGAAPIPARADHIDGVVGLRPQLRPEGEAAEDPGEGPHLGRGFPLGDQSAEEGPLDVGRGRAARHGEGGALGLGGGQVPPPLQLVGQLGQEVRGRILHRRWVRVSHRAESWEGREEWQVRGARVDPGNRPV